MNPTRTQDLRAEKTRHILERFLDGRSWSRRELQDETRISYGTISIVLGSLERAGIVELERLDASDGGRRAGRYRIVRTYRVFAQLEIKTYGFDWSIRDMTGAEIAAGIVPDDRSVPINDVLEKAIDAVLAALGSAGLEIERLHSIGVSIPGHYRVSDDVVVQPSTPRIGELAIAHSVGRRFSGELLVESDVNAAALFDLERVLSPAGIRGTLLYLAVTPDGVGSSLLLNGTIHYGATGHAGEVHMLPVSTAEGWMTLGDFDPPNVAERISVPGHGQPRFDQLRTMIRTRHERTERLYPGIVDAFAQGIYLLDSVLDPDAVVLAGIYCGFGPRFARDVRRRLVEISEPSLMDDVRVLQSDGNEGLASSGLYRLQTIGWTQSIRLPG